MSRHSRSNSTTCSFSSSQPRDAATAWDATDAETIQLLSTGLSPKEMLIYQVALTIAQASEQLTQDNRGLYEADPLLTAPQLAKLAQCDVDKVKSVLKTLVSALLICATSISPKRYQWQPQQGHRGKIAYDPASVWQHLVDAELITPQESSY